MMSEYAYRIRGGYPINGEIECLGAKNFVTKAMVAALLTDSPVELYNVPPIGDVKITSDMLMTIGMDIEEDNKQMRLDASAVNRHQVSLPDSGSNRIPILLLSALLHRFNNVSVPRLGGCKIGDRNVDFHLNAIRAFGGIVEERLDGYHASRDKRLRGAHINLPYPSVGATETCLYLAVLAEGRSIISNAAMEPEIQELITMLRSMGAIIFTSSGREIRVEGVEKLNGIRQKILGDRIEAASWACLACASDGNIIVHGIRAEILGSFLSYFQLIGGGVEQIGENDIRFFRNTPLQHTIIETDVYPGFSTDWQQPFAILLTQAEGVSVIHETVYENRFGYLSTLNALGAKTQISTHCLGQINCRYKDRNYEHTAIIIGKTQLTAIEKPIIIPDLRAGLAYVIAAAIAKGVSIVTGIEFLERGYGNIAPRLSEMNLHIERIDLAGSDM
jgi:UDP-N-acetylglucosamine 1-carboxyvinyltransferase